MDYRIKSYASIISKYDRYLDSSRHASQVFNDSVGVKGIQLVTISRPTTYGDYSPYTFAKDEQEFVRLVKAMRY